jgi:hypothetical protein
MEHIIEQTRDATGQALYELDQRYRLPDRIKQSSSAVLCGSEAVQSHLFADPVRRRFPHHTKSACWLSFLFLQHNRRQIPEQLAEQIEANLEKAAKVHGLVIEFDQIRQQVETVKQAAVAERPPSAYLFTTTGRAGETIRRLPVESPADLRKAAAWFETYRDEFLWPDRKKIAQALLSKSAEFGQDLTEDRPWLEATAGIGTCSGGDAAELLEQRASLLARLDSNSADLMRKVAREIRNNPGKIQSSDFRNQVCEVVVEADRAIQLEPGVKLAGNYGNTLARPESVLFAIKKSSVDRLRREHVATRTGAIYATSDLSRLRKVKIAEALGHEIARELAGYGLFCDPELASTVLPKLSLRSAQHFAKLAKDNGIDPVVRPDRSRRRLDRETLTQLANEYQTA